MLTVDDAPDLTGRDREVADLAASGLSSRAIGERLGITTRTVDNLLGRVYVKLGVSGHAELVGSSAGPRHRQPRGSPAVVVVYSRRAGGVRSFSEAMEQDNATAGLPITYQQVLAWVDDGRSADDIAADLGIDVQAVDPLIHLAGRSSPPRRRPPDSEEEP